MKPSQRIVNKPGPHYNTTELGEAVINEKISVEKILSDSIAPKNSRIESDENEQSLLIERIKTAISQFIYLSDEPPKQNFSDFISKRVNRDYKHLSHLFSGSQGVTIEEYIIAQKIERVKELLVYTELSLTDIVYKLQYSSVAQLTKQFIKVTGVTPAFYRLLRNVGHNKSGNV